MQKKKKKKPQNAPVKPHRFKNAPVEPRRFKMLTRDNAPLRTPDFWTRAFSVGTFPVTMFPQFCFPNVTTSTQVQTDVSDATA